MRFRVKGLEEYTRKIERLSNVFVLDDIIEKALHKGADVVADKTRANLMGIPVDNRRYVEGQRNGLLQVQKNGLLNSFGISEIQKKRIVTNIKTGVDKGTNKIGQPNVTIARRLESGTSYMKKNPVFKSATKSAKSECLQVISETVKEGLDRIMAK